MGEWSPYTLSEFEWKVLQLYIEYGSGYLKMYDTTFFTGMNDETVILTIDEFSKKAMDEDGNLWMNKHMD